MEAAGEQESLCEIRQSTGAIGCGLSPPENVIVAISAELENRAVIKSPKTHTHILYILAVHMGGRLNART